MSNRLLKILGGATAALCAGFLIAAMAPAAASGEEEIAPVHVTNFPAKQVIEGQVRINAPVPLAAMAAIREVEVPPRLSQALSRANPAGTIETDGFGAVVLSLAANQVGHLARPGEVSALLVPDEESILEVYERTGVAQFALELTAICAPGGATCSSIPSRQVVAFPRYKVYLFNTTERLARIDLYAYLTH